MKWGFCENFKMMFVKNKMRIVDEHMTFRWMNKCNTLFQNEMIYNKHVLHWATWHHITDMLWKMVSMKYTLYVQNKNLEFTFHRVKQSWNAFMIKQVEYLILILFCLIFDVENRGTCFISDWQKPCQKLKQNVSMPWLLIQTNKTKTGKFLVFASNCLRKLRVP